jgi:hypothetical protein
MKKILAVTLLAFSMSSMANIITCSGLMTDTSIVLDLSGETFQVNKAEYHFENRIVPTSGYEFKIQNDERSQKLTYKFRTLRRHGLAKKNLKLVLTIKQASVEANGFDFILNDIHVADLKIDLDGPVAVLDQMTCK